MSKTFGSPPWYPAATNLQDWWSRVDRWGRLSPPAATWTARLPKPNWVNLIVSCSAGSIQQVDGWGWKSPTQSFNVRLPEPDCFSLIDTWSRKSLPEVLQPTLGRKPTCINLINMRPEKPTCSHMDGAFTRATWTARLPEPNWVNLIVSSFAGSIKQVNGRG